LLTGLVRLLSSGSRLLRLGWSFALLALSLEHNPEKHALGLDPWVDFRFSEKIMLQLENQPLIRFNLIESGAGR
jgi:hypothetical protein